MKSNLHLGISPITGIVYMGTTSTKDSDVWILKQEVDKNEFVSTFISWIEHESEGTNTVAIIRNGKPHAEISLKMIEGK